MVQTFVEVIMKNGSVTEFPVQNLDNFKRLCGHEIQSIKPKKTADNFVSEIVSTSEEKPKRKTK